MFALSVTCAPFISSALSQVIEIRDYRGKQISCVTSGLSGFGRSCGTGDSYETVFVGSVVSVTEVTDTERRLQLMPEEVFSGNADGLLTVNTSQGACLGDFQAGDKWLFYLQRDTKTKALLLSYGSPTRPIADAQKEISLLRRLVQMDNSGIIMGQVTEPIWNDNKWERSIPVPDYKIVAKQQQSGREYAAFTDGDGQYEFQPLPPGAYHLSANTAEGLRVQEGTTTIRPRSCSQVGFTFQPDGRISGRVTAADGKPARSVQVAVVPVSIGNLQFTSAVSDELGRFEVKDLHPGRYLVGVGIQSQAGSANWRARPYYPGVRDRNLAVIVDVGWAEKRTNIDFQLPSSPTP
jgi:Carboxypeptidase regulatory-like domain